MEQILCFEVFLFKKEEEEKKTDGCEFCYAAGTESAICDI